MRSLEGQQPLGLCEQEHSQQIRQVHLLSSASQTTPSSVTQFQTPKTAPKAVRATVLVLWGEAEQLGLAQRGEKMGLGRP